MTLAFNITRFTYAPDEACPTADAAIAARSPVDWICYNSQSTLTLRIDQYSPHNLMKCVDGEDTCVYPLRNQSHALTIANMEFIRYQKSI